MKNLFKLVTILTLVSSFNTYAGPIECADIGSGSYPVSIKAQELAKALSVRTCDGKKFKAAVKYLKVNIGKVPATAKLINEVNAGKKTKMDKRVKKALGSFKLN